MGPEIMAMPMGYGPRDNGNANGIIWPRDNANAKGIIYPRDHGIAIDNDPRDHGMPK
jgi:hypothetical protein